MTQKDKFKFIVSSIKGDKNINSFLSEFFSAVKKANKTRDNRLVNNCLDDWFATAEVRAIPRLSKNTLRELNAVSKKTK